MTPTELLRVRLGDDQDVFTVRRIGRVAAELAGLEAQDQIRVATALSEIGRELLAMASPAAVIFGLTPGELVITFERDGGPPFQPSEGVTLARRLMDDVRLDQGGGVITLVKRTSANRRRVSVADTRAALARLAPVNALDELREQNRELAATLEEVLRLNTELQETNQGVVALYNQLSAEMEETNRGVVALYAELEDKSSQLREAAATRNRFWATVSHELRTPLNSIIGLVRLLIGQGGDPLADEQRHQIGLIGDSAETLLGLVGELLDMAKAESGRVDPQPTSVDTLELAEQLRLTMGPAAHSRAEVDIVIDVAEDARRVFVDETMLIRILRNLMSNALKFTDRGEVRLTARLDAAAGGVVLAVSDTGIGISDADHERVFEEFYQVPGPIQARARGTGLGLPYARRLAEAMGGTLELTSSLGDGTVATLRIPHHMGPPEVERILVADDDEAFRAGAHRLLSDFAAHVDEAADGVAALELMTANPPDLVLLDLLMPRLDGGVLLQRMAEQDLLRDIPVVVVTIAPDQAPEGFPVLSKQGLRRDQLLEVVRAAIRRRGDD
ncbi:response regulator [Streptosporangiaceae bacterium NEAU-GS5]|nr:response regulator [Streptosporangiaceae bacterium NEAU-GS5]